MVTSVDAGGWGGIGEPLADGRQPMRLKRSAPRVAKTRQTSSWCSPRMLTVNVPAASIFGQVVESCDAQNNTSGGFSDTDVKEVADTPMGSPSLRAVMIVTPVAK